MLNYTLGTIEASEALIKDLYIDLRAKVNAWSKITQQTPQARMGYVGQHLVSVVTGYPGGKSGARGYDLVIDDERHGEIKTCYRVDQLGSCNACGAVVSSLETECAVCSSTSINRKDDSKWLIAIRNNDEFAKLLDPYRYYFVLFEFESIYDSNNNDIIASIWEVDPKSKGFAYCMIDYYLNIRSQSTSKAPFNMCSSNLFLSIQTICSNGLAVPQAKIKRIKSSKFAANGYTFWSTQLSGLQANTISPYSGKKQYRIHPSNPIGFALTG